ncbi:MAG TPA: trypsin-like peptidase domain-containing protein [Marmoricola sp.]
MDSTTPPNGSENTADTADTTALPPVPPQPPTPPAGPYAGQHAHPSAGRRIAAAVGAAALVVGAGVGGLAVGRATVGGQSQQPTSMSTTSPTTPFEGEQGGSGYGYGYGYAQPYGGGQTQQQFGQQFGQQSGEDSSAESSSTASSSQITGLVRIQTTMAYEDGEGAGTGMILTSDGEVLTNHHVVEGATKIVATVMSTGKTYDAKVVGTDATADVAVIQLEGASGLSTVKTDTDSPSVGDSVTAVGDANGTTEHLTASPGTVSALAQTITTSSEGGDEGETLHNLIEIAANVVGGDSGGAVYDSDGEVVGMTTAASTTQSIGYAIPIKTALDVAEDLENKVSDSDYAYGRPAFLGIALSTRSTSPTVAKVYDDTAAADAGLKAGDTITRVGSTRVRTATALQNAIRSYSPGDTVKLTWTDADGTSHIGTATLGEGPVS